MHCITFGFWLLDVSVVSAAIKSYADSVQAVHVCANRYGYVARSRRTERHKSPLTCCSAFNSVNSPSVSADASHGPELGLISPQVHSYLPRTLSAPGRRGSMKWWINFISTGFYGDGLTNHPCASLCGNSSASGGS